MEAFIIMITLVIVVLVIGGLWAKRFFGYSCEKCGTKLQPFEKLSECKAGRNKHAIDR